MALVMAGVFALTPVSARQNPPAAPPQQRPPVFRAGANFVLVDAYPQRDGRIVEGLTAADFEILEDGKPQAIDSLEFVRIEPALAVGERRDPNNLNEMKVQAEDPHNRVFVTFLDMLHTTASGSHAIRRPLVDTLNRLVGPTDLFGVMTQNMRPQDLTLGRRLDTIEEQLARYWPWGERHSILPDAQDPGEDSLTACFHDRWNGLEWVPWILDDGPIKRYFDEILIERRREDRALTALENLIGYMGGVREARTVVLAVTDGWLLFTPDRALNDEPGKDLRAGQVPRVGEGTIPNPGGVPTRVGRGTVSVTEAAFSACTMEASRLAMLDDERRLRDLIALANRSNVSVYPIASAGLAVFDGRGAGDKVMPSAAGMAGSSILGRDMNRLTERVQTLRTIAENTDGIAVVESNDLAGGLRRIVDDVSAYYLLGYYSTNTKFDGRLRRIQVKVKPPGVNVRARRGYLAPSDVAIAKAEAASTGANVNAPRADAGVDDALGVLGRLRLGADLFTHGAPSGDDLVVSVELASRLVTPRLEWTKGADVSIEVTSGAGQSVGTASARIEAGSRGVVVRVPTRGVAGPWRVSARVLAGREALDERLELVAATTKLLGAPVTSRATPSPRAPLRPVADFQFRRTERVHVEWPVIGTLDQRVARLLDRRGQPLAVPVTLTEREADGRAMAVVDVLLSALTEGDYVIELVAGRGAETERALVAFRLVR